MLPALYEFCLPGKIGVLSFSQIGFIKLFKDEVMGYVMLRIFLKQIEEKRQRKMKQMVSHL